MNRIIKDIETVVGEGNVLTGDDVSSRSAGNWGSPGSIKAKALVRPQTTDEVAAVMRLCHAAKQTVVVHGGLTNLVQSATSHKEDIVISLELMQQIEEIDAMSRTLTCQAGAILQTVQRAAEEAGLMFALDLGARGSCMIGGNIATNAGGTQVIRYGMTREQVLGLEVVLADGTILSSMNKIIKNNAGYDLKQLFIGSEGTLGVVTRAVLRLRERPRSRNTAFVGVENFEKMIALLKSMDAKLGGTLSAFEAMWRSYYEFVTTRPAPHRAPLEYSYPYYVLLEALGSDEQRDRLRFEEALAQASDAGLVGDAVISTSQAQRKGLWEMRDDVHQLLRLSPLFLFDVSVPISNMKKYVEKVTIDLNRTWKTNQLFVFGHLGDGNLHMSVTAGHDDEETRRKVEEIVYGPLMRFHGSVSAEHGIGLEKKAYLSWCRSDSELALMRALKQALDPHGILNRGKVF